MMMLNNKEIMMLNDQKKHEQLCIDKYNEYSDKASDVQLKNLFSSISQKEQQHLQSINQILSGTVPNVNSGSQSQQNSQMYSNSNILNTSLDKLMCEDSLSTEKFVSSTYNTAIFEFRDPQVRQVLNHIQKEEQEHGQQIYDYMNQHGLYN